jgi:hypothetical protein
VVGPVLLLRDGVVQHAFSTYEHFVRGTCLSGRLGHSITETSESVNAEVRRHLLQSTDIWGSLGSGPIIERTAI